MIDDRYEDRVIDYDARARALALKLGLDAQLEIETISEALREAVEEAKPRCGCGKPLTTGYCSGHCDNDE